MNEIKQNRITSPESRPRNWPMRTIGSFCKVVRGSSPRPGGSPLYFNGDHLPWITVGEVTSHGQMHLRTTSSKLTEEGAKQTRILQPNTLILTNSGATLGVPKITTFVAGANDGIAAFLNVNGMVIEFLYFALQAQTEFMRERLAPGVGQPNLNTEIISELLVPCPPVGEQKHIAALLTTWDDAIELTGKLIAAKQRRKAALMQLLLTGKVRLPGFGGSPVNNGPLVASLPAAVWRGTYPPSVQPGIPKIAFRPSGWEETTMQKLVQFQKRPIELQDDKVYQLVVAKRNRGGIEPRERLLGREIKTQTQFAVHQGDFVISRRQIIHGACGVVPPSLDGAIVSNEYAVCRVNGKLNIDFLKYLTHTLYFQQTCFHASVGVALEKMIFRLEPWLTFPFLIPPIPEQVAIAGLLMSADSEIDLHEKKLDALRRQKKGLMQQLLTGKVRVNVIGNSGD